jgi:hypothetical protein
MGKNPGFPRGFLGCSPAMVFDPMDLAARRQQLIEMTTPACGIFTLPVTPHGRPIESRFDPPSAVHRLDAAHLYRLGSQGVRFAPDSPVEGNGFEPSVPHGHRITRIDREIEQRAFELVQKPRRGGGVYSGRGKGTGERDQ